MNHKHGLTESREYGIWTNMKTRCLNVGNIGYPLYGGRGILICDEWRNDFAAFLRDMGPCPEGLTLDRIDCDGNYEPGNCRWTDWTQQQNNRRNNRLIVWMGQTRTLAEWAKTVGISQGAFSTRLRKMPMERAMTPGKFHNGGPRSKGAHGTA